MDSQAAASGSDSGFSALFLKTVFIFVSRFTCGAGTDASALFKAAFFAAATFSLTSSALMNTSIFARGISFLPE